MLASITATCHHSCAAPPSRAAEPSLRPIGLTATDVYGDRRPTRQRGAASVRRPAALRTDASAPVRKALTLVSRPWRARAAWHRADWRTCSTIWCSSDITRHSAGLICTARASAPHRAIPTCVGRFPLGPKPPCAVLARLAFGRHRSACARLCWLGGVGARYRSVMDHIVFGWQRQRVRTEDLLYQLGVPPAPQHRKPGRTAHCAERNAEVTSTGALERLEQVDGCVEAVGLGASALVRQRHLRRCAWHATCTAHHSRRKPAHGRVNAVPSCQPPCHLAPSPPARPPARPPKQARRGGYAC